MSKRQRMPEFNIVSFREESGKSEDLVEYIV